jgi:hypothetical protein
MPSAARSATWEARSCSLPSHAIGPQWEFCAASRMPAASVTSAKSGRMASTIGWIWRGMDAPHAQEAELAAGAARVLAHNVGIVELRGHVVDRNDAIAQRSGGDFAFGASNQRMRKLSRRTHRAAGNCAVMGADEIHQAKVDGFDMGQGRNLPHLVQRARRFDQHMDRNFALDVVERPHFVEGDYLGQCVVGVCNLGQHEIRQLLAGTTNDDSQVFSPMRMGHIVDAGTKSFAVICRVPQQVGDHRRMFGLAAGRSAILAVGGDVEDRAFVDQQFGLQLERFANVLFRTGKVLAGGERREGLGPVVQNGGRMKWKAHECVLRSILASVISREGWRRRLVLPAVRRASCPSSCASTRRWPGLQRACTHRSRR